MKVVVLDESQKKNDLICDALQKKKHKVISCKNSSAFLESLEETSIDRICMNVDSWQSGRSLYKYFNVPAIIGEIPVIFYNAPENFVNIPARAKNEGDLVLPKPTEPPAVVDAVA